MITQKHRVYKKIAYNMSKTLAKLSNHVTTAHETATLAYGSSPSDNINESRQENIRPVVY